MIEFKECDKCAKKSGTPELCSSCKINSFAIHTQRNQLQHLELTCANLRRELNAFRRKANYVPIIVPIISEE